MKSIIVAILVVALFATTVLVIIAAFAWVMNHQYDQAAFLRALVVWTGNLAALLATYAFMPEDKP